MDPSQPIAHGCSFPNRLSLDKSEEILHSLVPADPQHQPIRCPLPSHTLLREEAAAGRSPSYHPSLLMHITIDLLTDVGEQFHRILL